MRGIRIAMVFAIPFILGALYTGIQLIYFGNEIYLVWLLGCMLVLIALYFASGEINYRYNLKYPPKLDPPIIGWLQNYFPFYNTLHKDEKVKFENRLALYLDARAFNLMLKERDRIPEDFKAIIAAHAIRMGFNLKDFLIGDYDRIICYNHPFPTPQNKFLHTVETHHEDGVILLSIEQLMAGIGQPKKNYNIAYHAYADALIHLIPNLSNNIDPIEAWMKIGSILPFAKDHIHKTTGYEELDVNTVALSSYFINQEGFRLLWPEQYDHFQKLLKDE